MGSGHCGRAGLVRVGRVYLWSTVYLAHGVSMSSQAVEADELIAGLAFLHATPTAQHRGARARAKR